MRLTLASSDRKLYILKDDEDKFTIILTIYDAAAWIELDRRQAKEIVKFLQEQLNETSQTPS